jgi:hypothetical protein
MSVQLAETANGRIVEVNVTGKLGHEDYERFVPEIERLMARHGRIRVLVQLHDFHGWSAGALWDDIRFDARHFRDIERIAIVGESAWEHGMAVFCKPFTTAEIRYYDRGRTQEARAWLEEGETD